MTYAQEPDDRPYAPPDLAGLRALRRRSWFEQARQALQAAIQRAEHREPGTVETEESAT